MDPKWCVFAAICRQEFATCIFQDRLIAECQGNEDIAWATYFHLREHALDWIHEPVPALGKEMPMTLLTSGRADEVRYCLWSMPC